MKYRLGLDMGTSSIGWAIDSLSEDNTPVDVIDMGVRIFDGGRNPKTYESLAVERRIARGIRRMRDRRIGRKKRIIFSLIEENLMPVEENERKALQLLNPYFLRKKALDKQLTKYELGRALFHLGTRRGFKSNRKNETDSDSKKQARMITNLDEKIQESNTRTVGEYLFMRINNKEKVRFDGSFDLYPSRNLYEEEFRLIQKKQSEFYHEIDWEKIYQAIFYQRSLKSQEKGKCRYYPEENRAYKALPSAQEFRILSDINNLIAYDLVGNSISLSNNEKDALFQALNNCKSKNFNTIRKMLDFVDEYSTFNLESEKNKELKGNDTSVNLRKPECFGSAWDNFSLETQDTIVEYLISEHSDEEVFEFLDNYNLTEDQKNNIAGVSFSKSVGSLSAKFMRNCVEVMQKEHVNYSDAVSMMGLDHSAKEIEKMDFLPYYGRILSQHVIGAHQNEDLNDVKKYGKISNPTVHIALGQLQKVVNSLIVRYGKPSQIVVELSRDIAIGVEEKKNIDEKQTQNKKENDRIKKEISEIANIPNPSREDIKKYKLWEELGSNNLDRCCPYCGRSISGSKLFSKEVEIEHILPYSRTLMDSMNNLTIAHVSCNDYKGNRSPYEAFSSNPDGYNWESIRNRIKNLPKKKQDKFLPNSMDRFRDDTNFLQSQLNDGRYISKATKEYLACICSDIWCVNGQNTAHLRAGWGLNHLLNFEVGNNSKNRNDHRHHAIDALVISLTDRSMIKKMADINVNFRNLNYYDVPDFPFNKEKVKDILRNMLISHRQDHGHEGKMFKETAAGSRMIQEQKSLKEVNKAEFKEERIVNEDVYSELLNLVKGGKTFNSAKTSLIKEKGDIPVSVLTPVWVTTTNIETLTDKDIKGDRIFNPYLNSLIKEKTSDVIDNKSELKKRLQTLSKDFGGLKKIKYVPQSQAFTQIKSAPYKGYERADVCFVIIWEIPKKGKAPEYRGQFISYKEVYEKDSGKLKEYPKPHPAAKKIATIYKKDVLYIQPKDGKTEGYYVLVAGYSTTTNGLDIRPLFSADTIEKWYDTVSREITPNVDLWKDIKNTQNFKSINVLYSENNIQPVKITPDGRIEC